MAVPATVPTPDPPASSDPTPDAGRPADSTTPCGPDVRYTPGADDRDSVGRFQKGNRVALTVGHRSLQLWQAQEDIRRGIEDAILSDSGHTRDDAPRTLLLAASGLAQAALIRDAAYQRIIEDGGPLTNKGRARRAFQVWLNTAERVHRGLTLIGLRRVPRHVDPLAALHAALAAEAPRPAAPQPPRDDIVPEDGPR